MIAAAKLIALFRQALEEKWGYIWGTAVKEMQLLLDRLG